jgi:predicted tellurium resistance membrane protein TerC
MISMEEHAQVQNAESNKSVGMVIFLIVVMNLVFSFDSILSAMALTSVFWVMSTAILISGVLMIFIAEKVSEFLKKNRMYEVLGLFILFLVGVMLLSEGGHLAHLSFFENEITPMNKTTFYFIIVILILTDVAQSRYKRKLVDRKELNEEDL